MFFKGTGALKPFVPTQMTPTTTHNAQNRTFTKDSEEFKGEDANLKESMMNHTDTSDAFAFLKADDDLQEWEANQEELDR